MFGKLINNKLTYAPKSLVIDGIRIINPTDEMYLEQGYLPIEHTEKPTTNDGHYAFHRWVVKNGKILQKWNVAKDTRPLTMEEVNAMLIKQQINSLEVDDSIALRMLLFYPEWTTNASYDSGFKVRYGSKLYRALQAHTSQDGWQPTSAGSLWVEICETFSGNIDEPIPYTGNMVLENGKYYIQDSMIYKCFRDSVNPVYNALVDLVSIYVEII